MKNFFTWLRIQRLKLKLIIVKLKERINIPKKRSILWIFLAAIVSLCTGFFSVYFFQSDSFNKQDSQEIYNESQLGESDNNIEKDEKKIIVEPKDIKPVINATTPTRSIDYLDRYIKQNSDTVGYIKIDGTKVDYPVVQSDDNKYYMNRSFNKLPNVRGAIFMDYRCDSQDFSKTRNIILYGHRMKNGTMFKGLIDYDDEDFFNEHRIIQFDTIDGAKNWEVFAVFRTTTDFYYIDTDFPHDEMWVAFLNACYKESMYKTAPTFSPDDIVLTLSTCTTNENGRFVVMAKLIKNQV